jgi:S1-C subfamily serine protease
MVTSPSKPPEEDSDLERFLAWRRKRRAKKFLQFRDKKHWKRNKFFGRLLAYIVGIATLYGLFFAAFIITGASFNDTISRIQNAQLLFWYTIWGIVLLALVRHLSGKRKTIFWYQFRHTFVFWGCLVILGTGIGTIVQYVNFVHESAAPACSLSDQLKTARSAVYSLASNDGWGSAIAIDGNGTLLTANHVIDGENILYTWDYDTNHVLQKIPVTVIKTAPDYDLALVHANFPVPPSYLSLTNADDSMLGQDVYAIGFPGNTFNAGNATISKGIVSRIVSTDTIPNAPTGLSYVQTDAAINPGNSGGALIGPCGVIGVVDAASDSEDLHDYGLSVSEQNISYAISTSAVKQALGL